MSVLRIRTIFVRIRLFKTSGPGSWPKNIIWVTFPLKFFVAEICSTKFVQEAKSLITRISTTFMAFIYSKNGLMCVFFLPLFVRDTVIFCIYAFLAVRFCNIMSFFYTKPRFSGNAERKILYSNALSNWLEFCNMHSYWSWLCWPVSAAIAWGAVLQDRAVLIG
jgi:hypothetical protein